MTVFQLYAYFYLHFISSWCLFWTNPWIVSCAQVILGVANTKLGKSMLHNISNCLATVKTAKCKVSERRSNRCLYFIHNLMLKITSAGNNSAVVFQEWTHTIIHQTNSHLHVEYIEKCSVKLRTNTIKKYLKKKQTFIQMKGATPSLASLRVWLHHDGFGDWVHDATASSQVLSHESKFAYILSGHFSRTLHPPPPHACTHTHTHTVCMHMHMCAYTHTVK